MAKGGQQEQKKDDGMTVIAVMLGSLLLLTLLIWQAAKLKIIKVFTTKLFFVGKLWLFVPGIGQEHYMNIWKTGTQFVNHPKDVGIIDWLGYVNETMAIPNYIIALLFVIWITKVMMSKNIEVKRKFKPQDLAIHLSHVFTGIAPVLHLRKSIAKNTESYWKRQTFPHEVLLNERIYGKAMVVNNEPVEERIKEYFCGLKMHKAAANEKSQRIDRLVPDVIGGRLVSTMLGRQVVDILSDRGKKPCYPDRFSPIGKVIYALLCAHAFGGNEGKKDYAKARDQLNNSARNAAHGFANITVAQWLYDKYRTNPQAKMLFAIHHWEYTYLWELLIQAKRQGKCGHWEYLWLKPMNRILFYTQNTVGRLTPHTESAAAFSQYIYERRVAKMGRLPIMPINPDGTGGYKHTIFIDKAVEGLVIEWERWRDGEDDDNLWWKDEDIWKRLDNIQQEPPIIAPPDAIIDTAFDRSMSYDANIADAKRKSDLDNAIRNSVK